MEIYNLDKKDFSSMNEQPTPHDNKKNNSLQKELETIMKESALNESLNGSILKQIARAHLEGRRYHVFGFESFKLEYKSATEEALMKMGFCCSRKDFAGIEVYWTKENSKAMATIREAISKYGVNSGTLEKICNEAIKYLKEAAKNGANFVRYRLDVYSFGEKDMDFVSKQMQLYLNDKGLNANVIFLEASRCNADVLILWNTH